MDDDSQSESAGIIERISLYKLPIILGGGSCFIIVLSLILLVKSTQTAIPIQFSTVAEASSSALGAASIMVDVAGAVVRPGVYTLRVGARVEDAIGAAGGLASDVDSVLFAKNINRANKIVDGAKLYIPKLGDTETQQSKTSHNADLYGRSSGTSYNLSTGLNGQTQNSALVSVNLASESELDTLPGVGPATAQKIISNRPYQTLDELVTKKAIGPSLYEKLKNNLSL